MAKTQKWKGRCNLFISNESDCMHNQKTDGKITWPLDTIPYPLNSRPNDCNIGTSMGQHYSNIGSTSRVRMDTLLHSLPIIVNIPANTTRWPNAGLMLAHRLRRWANISPALGQSVVFAGIQLGIDRQSWSRCPLWCSPWQCRVSWRLSEGPLVKGRVIILSAGRPTVGWTPVTSAVYDYGSKVTRWIVSSHRVLTSGRRRLNNTPLLPLTYLTHLFQRSQYYCGSPGGLVRWDWLGCEKKILYGLLLTTLWGVVITVIKNVSGIQILNTTYNFVT